LNLVIDTSNHSLVLLNVEIIPGKYVLNNKSALQASISTNSITPSCPLPWLGEELWRRFVLSFKQ